MKDMQVYSRKIRTDAAECLLLGNLATDGKQELFARIADHLNALAGEVEKTITTNSAELTPVTQPLIESSPQKRLDHVAYAADNEQATVVDHKRAKRARRMLPWLLVIALAAIAALTWVKHREDPSLVATVQSKPEPVSAPQNDAMQAMVAALAGQQRERKLLTEQLSALAARVDHLEKAHVAVPSTKQSVSTEEKSTAAEAKPSIPEQKPVRTEEKGTSSQEKTAAAEISDSNPKQSDGVPPWTGKPADEPADRVGTVPVPTRAELDPRKLTIGPAGCTRFRSFDPVSGTYTTFSGQRRQCQIAR